MSASGYSGVRTTGIYCRPGCGGRPLAKNVTPFKSAAAAEAAGLRACFQCRPYRTSDLESWVDGPELVCRGVRLIIDGYLDHHTETELAARIGVSARHLRRLFADQIGATPDQVARSRRAHFARRLLDDTDLSLIDVAYAAGFGSVRQFNRTMQDTFRASPKELRARRRKADRLAADGGLALRLPYTPPLDWQELLAWFGGRAVDGAEVVDGDTYRRTILVEGQPGVIEVSPGGEDHLLLRAHLPYWDGLIHVVQQVRRMFGLDHGAEVDENFAEDPELVPLVAARPGLRVPGSWDGFEVGVRAILGQQVTVAGARTLAGRLVERLGEPVPGLTELGLTHTFPPAEVVAGADLTGLGLTGARMKALTAFATAVRDGEVRLDGSVSLDEFVRSVVALPGLGEWTAQYLALRLGEPDAFPAGDLGLRKALANGKVPTTRQVADRAEAWRPWRAQAAIHLWALRP
jgi:AraC family transcriptional regulator, regulatory protein of adaptative response / DNA-3-methyladenine glycosylase II